MRSSSRPRRAVLAVTLLVAAPFAAAQTWQELGPAPIQSGQFTGRISAVACSATDADRYYVGGADGGVWSTADGGATWTPLTDLQCTLSIGALAIDPADDQVVYAGTGEANYANHSRYGLGILKTVDGGATWAHLAEDVFAGRTFSRIVVDPLNANVLYAAVARAGGFPELAAAKGHPGATGPTGVFKSVDAGLTWSQLAGGLPTNLAATDLALDPLNPQILYAAVGRIFGAPGNGVYKTTNGGATWSKLGGGLPTSGNGRIGLAIAPSSPNRVYALITHPSGPTGGGASTRGAWRTDDGGASWSPIAVPSIQSSFGWYLAVVSVRPTDASTAIFGGVSLTRTSNSGASFTTITPPHVDMHAVAWDAAGRMVVGDDGGVHRSSNLGASWTSLNCGLGTIQFYAGLSTHPSSAETLLGGTQDNGTNLRTAPGLAWTQVFGGDGGFTQIDQQNPLRMFVEFQGTGNLFASSNGGASFFSSATGINFSDRNAFLPPFLIDPANSNRMLYGTQRVYASANAGASWTAISGDLSTGTGAIRALALAPSDTSTVYAATNDGNVLVSTNGGAAFQTVRTGHPGWPRVTRELTVDPADATTAYLATAFFGTDQVLRTQNGGLTWVALDGDLPDVPVNVVALDTSTGLRVLYAGTDQGLWISANEGRSWNRHGTGLPNAVVIDVRIDVPRGRVLVATQGRGCWSAPLAGPAGARSPGASSSFGAATVGGG